ncbi:transport and golgi organization 2 [Brevipalpus obovatus]|uniref:transport and golgi organization 2 n=1 Tax=Brevipalpus obovatus TaxID=246614 RepID=UPI003D9DF1A1
MCMLFFSIDTNPSKNGYKLILASVRDEYFKRPTRACCIWPQNSDIIGGQDLEPNREGGTWLAMNKRSGKIGVLLNVFQPGKLRDDAKGRGKLVTDYLIIDDDEQYMENIIKSRSEYNGFTLVLISLSPCIKATYLNNIASDDIVSLDSGVHAFGNSENPQKPWAKINYGKSQFIQILKKFPTTNTQDRMVEAIFSMLSDRTRLPSDRTLLEQAGESLDFAENLNALFVEIPTRGYGTRTWTVIIVDGNNNALFHEKTRKDPIICSPEKVSSEWVENKFRFEIKGR